MELVVVVAIRRRSTDSFISQSVVRVSRPTFRPRGWRRLLRSFSSCMGRCWCRLLRQGRRMRWDGHHLVRGPHCNQCHRGWPSGRTGRPSTVNWPNDFSDGRRGKGDGQTLSSLCLLLNWPADRGAFGRRPDDTPAARSLLSDASVRWPEARAGPGDPVSVKCSYFFFYYISDFRQRFRLMREHRRRCLPHWLARPLIITPAVSPSSTNAAEADRRSTKPGHIADIYVHILSIYIHTHIYSYTHIYASWYADILMHESYISKDRGSCGRSVGRLHSLMMRK